jgi:Fur family ferric uptake transcriptional regulator
VGHAESAPVAADAALRSHGLRATPQRQAVLATLGELGHATPEELFAAAEPRLPGLSLSTVYRTLDSLVDGGLVRHAHFHGASRSYFLAEHAGHAHLVCERCERVVSLEGDALETFLAAVRGQHGFTVETDHVALAGICADCAG